MQTDTGGGVGYLGADKKPAGVLLREGQAHPVFITPIS